MRRLTATVLLLCCFCSPSLATADAPNIVVILADDMGYGDVQALNEKSTIPTPSLNRLAADGMTFSDAHSPSAVCTPTRYGLITGRYCWRSRLTRGVLNGYSSPLIEPDRPTIASLLKSQGYTCGIVGKWHLGLGFARAADGKAWDFSKPVGGGPNVLGFDFSHIIPASLDFPPYVYVRNGQVTELPTLEQPAQGFPAYLRRGERSPDLVMENCLDDLLKQATGYVERQAKLPGPFLLYFPLPAPHKPVLPHPRFRGKTKLGPYGDFVAQVDWTVGEMLRAIDDARIADNTLVIYSSDNGSFMHRSDEPDAADHVDDETVQAYRPDRHRANHALRGTKADIWEAGHRVPFFARWPGKVRPGSRCAETICLTDLFATFAEITGAKVPPGAGRDSFSMLALLEGASSKTPRPPVIHHSAAGMFAIRDGQWKLVLGNGSGGRQNPRGRPFARPYHLFDMSQDLSEQQNLIEQQADVAERLEKACEAIRGQSTRE
ncbi:MAG: arylsulfatase [Candidatus Nealsonbacteria bacterium]|nr:arylsulfatase [Candidatus Nealsonbacteria bacterium]